MGSNPPLFYVIICGAFVVMSLIMGNQIYQDNLKIDFLENALTTKNIEYTWLKEITDALMYGDSSYNFQEKFNEIMEEPREMYPNS